MTWTSDIETTINELYSYDPYTGILTYKRAPNRKPFLVGKEVGILRSDGYLVTKICQKQLLLHRVIWFFVTGFWVEEIDHDNRIRRDNRWMNLIDVTHWENSQNISKEDCTSKTIGVCYWGKGKWNAYLRGVSLGYFNSEADAITARQIAEAQNGAR